MTIHTSLKNRAGLAGERNVWTRVERLAALKKIGRWKDGDVVLGLPKVRTRFKTKAKKKEAKADAAAAPAAAGAPAAAAAAPAGKASAPAGKAAAAAPAAKGKK